MERSKILLIVACLSLSFFRAPAEAQQLPVSANHFSIAIGGAVTGSTVIVGVPNEKVDELVRERTRTLRELTDSQKETIALLKERLALNERQIHAALDIVGEAAVPTERLAAKLIEISTQLKHLKNIAKTNPGDSAEIAALKLKAQNAITDGEFAAADRFLSDVEDRQERTLASLAKNAAETSMQRGLIASTELRYLDAAKLYAKAARLLPPESRYDAERLAYLQQEALAVYSQGNEFGNIDSARLAIKKFRSLVALSGDATPVVRARNKRLLGRSLYDLSFREGNPAHLAEAVSIYKSALSEPIKQDDPVEWITIRANLAITLVGQSSFREDKPLLIEALAIFRELKSDPIFSRYSAQFDFVDMAQATARMFLAISDSSAAQMRTTIADLQAVIHRLPPERSFDKARANNLLGMSFMILTNYRGSENVDADLRQAIDHFRQALTVLTHKRLPIEWAETQSMLGYALATLGERESNVEYLQEASGAYSAALTEVTVEKAAIDWMATQFALGRTLTSLGAMKRDPVIVSRAIEAFAAILSHEDIVPPIYRAGVRAQMQQTRELLAKLPKG